MVPRRLTYHLALAALPLISALSTSACSSVLGLDPGLPDEDASADASVGVATEAAASADSMTAGERDSFADAPAPGDSEAGDAGSSADAPAEAPGDSEAGDAGACPAGQLACGSCVDPQTDPNNCTTCGNACPAVSHGEPTCQAGTCGVACNSGYGACGGACVDLTTDEANCGACGNACSALPHVAGPTTCQAGACVVPASSCAAGYAHCSAAPNAGCETDITTPAHCGACTTQCSSAAPVCSSGSCVTGCTTGMSLCGSSPSQTCVDVHGTDANNCGACGNACPAVADANATCTAGVCGFTCQTGSCQSGGACYPDSTDPLHCGGSCAACPGPSNAVGSATCTAGTCGMSCPTGDTLCGTACYGTTTDPTHCGSACTACVPPTGGTATCSAGVCGSTCDADYCPDGKGGCVQLGTAANCGTCGHSCGGLGCTTTDATGKCNTSPLIKASTTGSICRGITLDSTVAATWVYYTDGYNTGGDGLPHVLRCNSTGCAGTPQIVFTFSSANTTSQGVYFDSSTSLFASFDIAKGGNGVVYSLDPSVVPAPPSTTQANLNLAISTSAPSEPSPALATDASNVYFGDQAGTVWAAPKAGSGGEGESAVAQWSGLGGSVTGLAYDAPNSTMWAASGGDLFGCATKASCLVEKGPYSGASSVALGQGSLFFTALGTAPGYTGAGEFVATPASPSSAVVSSQVSGVPFANAYGLTVDASNTYFGAASSLYRCGVKGCTGGPYLMGAGTGNVTAVVNDASNVYWCADDGSVWVVGK